MGLAGSACLAPTGASAVLLVYGSTPCIKHHLGPICPLNPFFTTTRLSNRFFLTKGLSASAPIVIAYYGRAQSHSVTNENANQVICFKVSFVLIYCWSCSSAWIWLCSQTPTICKMLELAYPSSHLCFELENSSSTSMQCSVLALVVI